jgi:hypothetical protein
MQAQVFKPPMELPDCFAYERFSVFLAGSIEQGTAVDWQKEVTVQLAHQPVDIFNPRRDNWDATVTQSIDNPIFRGQVVWELDALDMADHILMVFDPKTMSPISLLELGLYAHTGKLVVVCPEGFWRKGNVDIVCARYGVKQVDTIEEALQYIINGD